MKWAADRLEAAAQACICTQTTTAYPNACINNIWMYIHLSSTAISLRTTWVYRVTRLNNVTAQTGLEANTHYSDHLGIWY